MTEYIHRTNKSFAFESKTRIRLVNLFLAMLIPFLGFSQSKKVQATIDTTQIRIGEQFVYKISVADADNVIIPKLDLKNLEVVDSLQMDTVNNKLIKKYILTGFDSGAFYIPQQQIFIRNKAYLTDSLLVNVATVAVDTSKIKKFPIKSIKKEPYQIDDFRHLWWVAVLVVLLILLLLYLFVFRKKTEDVVVEKIPTLPPYEEAMQQLKLLDEQLLWQNNKIKQYYSELTGIVRNYIERELHIPALESTTDELIDLLHDLHQSKSIVIEQNTIAQLQELLKEADLVKFAKSKPLSVKIEQDRKDAENILNTVKSKPIIVEEDAE